VAGGGDGPPLKASETIIRNLRVLATDQRTSAVDDEGKPAVQEFRTVTLESTPKIAEKIAVAQTIGQLSLSLRSIADNTAELERAIAAGEVSVPEGEDPKAERQLLLAVASRPIDTGGTFVTGADVSRFQRRTVPAKQQDRYSAPPSMGGGYPGSTKPSGPTVTIVRGNSVTEVPLGGKK
jgi:pilus assembly protein CpaB